MCQKILMLGKVSHNAILLYDLDIFRFQISIHTLKLDVPKNSPAEENITQWSLRKYQTMACCYMIWIILHSKYLFIHLSVCAIKVLPLEKISENTP